ncbi:MAG: LysR family transcriptional regulator, partial [Gammaproteobacteria bacterium]
QHMSISKTARALHMTPPAVSIQVKQLAEVVGQPLLEQMGKQIYLTETGKLVATACRDVFDRLEHLSQDLAALDKMERGRLRVSIISTASYFVPRLLGDFGEQHSGIESSLFIGNRHSVLERLSQNLDDLYILGQPPENLRVNALAFAPNLLVAAAYPNHRLAGKTAIPPKELANEPFLLREEGSGIRLATEKFFRSHRVPLNVRMELGSNEAVKQTVIARLGISFVTKSSIVNELERGELELLDIQGLPIERDWYIVHPAQKVLSPAAEKFRSFLISKYGYHQNT